MTPLRLFLEQKGWEVFNLGYPSLLRSIDSHVETVSAQIDVAVRGRSVELSFVTHSLGGIVLRALLERRGSNYRFGRAVMLGPPNQGASFARSLQSRVPWLDRILGPSYAELGRLDRPTGTDRISVGIIAGSRSPERGYSPFVSGPNDGIVAVAETALPGAADSLLVRGVHTLLMYQPTVLRQVDFFLTHGRFDKQEVR